MSVIAKINCRGQLMHVIIVWLTLCFGIVTAACGGWLDKGSDVLKSLGGTTGQTGLSNADIASAFKEALHIGTENVVTRLGRTDGFNADQAIHIPLPGQMETVRSALAKVGMSQPLDDLELKLNRAAENATPKAKSLFVDAISAMTFDDVKRIYNGPEDSATRYFRGKMTPGLTREIEPVVTESLSQVGAIQTYEHIMGQYRALPFVPDIKADLNGHVIQKSLDGIFYYVAKEEAAIRQDPIRQTTDLLKRVFGGQ
ncbi:DUF4197 domain-containing protein [Desulfosarcina sp.]|uniref:DUF4197 domain-containing protein n=1 Tax=Desulfosarcina sp. TaxID=2027861 RepID=UPI00356A7183